MKIVFAFVTILAFIGAMGQDTAWKRMQVDIDVSVLLPSNAFRIDSALNVIDSGLNAGRERNEIRLFHSSTANSEIELIVLPGGSLNNFASGICKEGREKGYACRSGDFPIGRLESTKIEYVKDGIIAGVHYCFYLNRKVYAITVGPHSDKNFDQCKGDIDKLLGSIETIPIPLSVQDEPAKPLNAKEKLGQIAAAVLGFLLLMAGIFWIARKTFKKT